MPLEPEVPWELGGSDTCLSIPSADQKYRNNSLDAWMKSLKVGYTLEIVERPAGAKGFVLLHHRWVVERTHAWVGRYRRNRRDYEFHERPSEAMSNSSSIRRMLIFLTPAASRDTPPFKYREIQGGLTG